MNSYKVTYCIPVFNEEEILLPYLRKITDGLDYLLSKNQYEIIIVDNGSTDKTPDLLRSLKTKYIKTYHLPTRGLGTAYKHAMKQASGEYIVLSAIDIPFGFDDLIKAKTIWEKYDIIFGSKSHPNSQTIIPFSRKLASFVYRTLLHQLFSVNIGDTQGSIFLKKEAALQLLPYLNASDAFFTAQIAIYGTKLNFNMIEIPVTHDKKNVIVRKSKYSILKDGARMLQTMIEEKIRIGKMVQNSLVT